VKPNKTLAHDVPLSGHDKFGTTCEVHRPLKIWEGKTHPKFSVIY